MKQLNILFFLLSVFIANAQTISGRILSENQPVSYAKIGVDGEKIGAIADQEGNFSINFDNIDRSKMVKIEVAGFEPYKTPVSDFVKSNPQNIQLKEKVHNISEVKINPKKLVDKNWGVNTKTKSIMYSVSPEKSDNFLHELALAFTTKKRTKLQKINLNIAGMKADRSIVLSFIIYSSKDGMPGAIMNETQISAALTKDKIVDDTFSIDVSGENIWLQGDFFVSMQVMNSFKGYLTISATPFRSGFLREYFGDWQKVSIIAPAINIDVKVDKNYKNEEEESKKASPQDEANFLKKYKNIADLQEAGRKTDFGHNAAAGNYFRTNDLEMYYETYGSGEPLFLLHGNGGSIQAFYKQIDEFSRYYKVIAVDTRAQGNSRDFTTKDFTYELFANDLKNLANHLKIKKANVIGWSDGGIIGLIYAMKYPENVDKLIAIGANINPEGVEKSDVEQMKSDLENLQKAQSKNINAIRLTKLMIEQPQITDLDLSKIKAPTSIVAGEHDLILPEHTREIAKSIPGSQLKIVKDASHSFIQEKPEEFNAFALKFLKTGKL